MPIFIRTGQLRHASYRMLDFLYNAPDDKVDPIDKKAIEEEWRRRELLTYEWPYLTMRERHRLRAELSTALGLLFPLLMMAIYLINKNAQASTYGYTLLSYSLCGLVAGFIFLGVLPVLVGRTICKLRNRQPTTARPDFRIGRTRAVVTASLLMLLGLAGILTASFLGPGDSAAGFVGSLVMLVIGAYYLWYGRPAASESSFVLWGRLHGRLKD